MLSNHSSVLPDGWIPVQHESGGLVYFHKPTRVCTWSKPYIVSTSKTIKVAIFLFLSFIKSF